ncbi:uncharacterized protein UV8b_05343 [Ustilaginoidea virens]|uniref:Vacuolar protein-sorting-associated protein 25 n=1 Tax=Ustilaginoidea virens TaxID=1159556 RepID=A0A063C5G3_USTVR|nr:uncharacterized protein UV8b_05343 [Ustilaginoidea virens]QUC21100.1 hypothetical protein UV8b_05343 [Ustilaginoidea virens]GAO14592.1 hypothetical protein UVI_02009540 [Ustilaginoidea virens]
MAAAAPAPSAPPSAPPSGFRFPPEYHFPPFFSPQPNLTTRHAQLTKWSALVLAYARHHRLFKLALASASHTDLFHNARIDRRLGLADIRAVLDFLCADGRAQYAGPRDGADVVYVYWRTLDEWASLVEAHVHDTAQRGSVLTVYELTQGEGTRGTELHGMDDHVLIKALGVLVKRGKAQIFGADDSLGVKFF